MFNKDRIGSLLCIFSLITYSILKLPLDLSVLSPSWNEGFSLGYGSSLLEWNELTPGRGPLLIFIYALIIKIFGFNTFTILALHYIVTILVWVFGFLLFFLVKKITNNSLYGGLATALWIVLISTPLRGDAPSLRFEILAHYALEPDLLCAFFSIISIYFLLLSNFFTEDKESFNKSLQNSFSFISGLFCSLSIMTKTSGAILFFSVIGWTLLLVIFKRHYLKLILKRLIFFFCGSLFGLIILSSIFYFYYGDIISSWKEYFFIGTYDEEGRKNLSTLQKILNFMTRDSNSINNFVLHLIAILLFVYGLIKGCLTKNNSQDKKLYLFWLLIGIWGLGNICAIIAPGMYQPYYYHLVWPGIAISYALGIREILPLNKKVISLVTMTLIASLIICRLFLISPGYYKIFTTTGTVNIFNQPQSFQDPVLPYNIKSSNRSGELNIADFINNLLPNKESTLYILNFHISGPTGLSPLTYIFAKRKPASPIDSSLLRVSTIIDKKIRLLKNDLTKRPPELVVTKSVLSLKKEETKRLSEFIAWLNKFLDEKYTFERKLNYNSDSMKKDQFETYLFYRRKI